MRDCDLKWMRLRLKDLQLLHGIFGTTIIQLFLKNCHSGSLLLFVEMEWSDKVEMASRATSCCNVNIWMVQSLFKFMKKISNLKTQAPLD